MIKWHGYWWAPAICLSVARSRLSPVFLRGGHFSVSNLSLFEFEKVSNFKNKKRNLVCVTTKTNVFWTRRLINNNNNNKLIIIIVIAILIILIKCILYCIIIMTLLFVTMVTKQEIHFRPKFMKTLSSMRFYTSLFLTPDRSPASLSLTSPTPHHAHPKCFYDLPWHGLCYANMKSLKSKKNDIWRANSFCKMCVSSVSEPVCS